MPFCNVVNKYPNRNRTRKKIGKVATKAPKTYKWGDLLKASTPVSNEEFEEYFGKDKFRGVKILQTKYFWIF